MGDDTIYKIILKWLWLKISKKMWEAGYGKPWMKNYIENL